MNNLQDNLTLRRVLRYILIEGSGTPEAVPSWLRDLSNKPRFGADTSETVCWKLLNVFVLNSNYIVYPMGGILALGKTLDYLIARHRYNFQGVKRAGKSTISLINDSIYTKVYQGETS